MLRTPILQFGTSRFLQAHADLFFHEANAGPVTVVQSSGNPERARRLAALADPEGYPVRICGLSGGLPVDEIRCVRSIRRALSTSTDWTAITRIAAEEAEIILSNTGDSGWTARPADGADRFDQTMSFPAKLALLLLARFRAGGSPIQVMPLELVARNGTQLRRRVEAVTAHWPPAFRSWLREAVVWADSLVDRIVSESLEPAGAVAEPYALWAIEARPGLRVPCHHPAVRLVHDLEPVEALKLYILNLSHTVLAHRWLRGEAPDTVQAALMHPAGDDLRRLIEEEVLPAFGAAGLLGEAQDFASLTRERLANPFLRHRLADIAVDHRAKVVRRIGGFLDWADRKGDSTPKPRLRAVLREAA